MKKKILLFAMLFPLLIFGKGGIIRSLDLYHIYNTNLRKSINTFVIPFLIDEKYLSSENVLCIYFDSDNSDNYVYVFVNEKRDVIWNDDIIGYTNISGYTCILSGNSYYKYVKKSIWNIPKIIVFNNIEVPHLDGIIEWLFRLEGKRMKFVRFISEW